MAYRFAPSPTGLLHLGHAYSALLTWDLAGRSADNFKLRIEDIDTPRCKPEFEQAIYDDLTWLGIRWPEPVLRQTDRLAVYDATLARLGELGLLFPCKCTRGDIKQAMSAPQEGSNPQPPYPGTCRNRSMQTRTPQDAIRLNMDLAISRLGGDAAVGRLHFIEKAEGIGPVFLDALNLHREFGDPVLARKDIGTSYHLAVVADDAAEQITCVSRGSDMKAATHLHRLLQELLELPVPDYFHHRLIRDDAGKRLAKRHDALALRHLRAQGTSPDEIRHQLNLPVH